MRRVILLALALALPSAALANSVDFTLGGGTMSLTPTSASISTSVLDIGVCTPNCSFSPATGTASLVFPTFNTTTSGSFGAGGSVSLSSASYIFNGTFTSGTWSVAKVGSKTSFSFLGYATGTLTVNGNAVQTTLVINTGQSSLAKCARGTCTIPFASGDTTINTVPEPGTLGLLGSGLVGLAGMVRRKFQS